MILANLAGVFTCEGFAKKQGRFPKKEDAGYIQGPVSILCNQKTGKIVEITKDHLQKDPFGEEIIDAEGLIATPGYVDSHTHALFLGNRTHEFFSRWEGKSYIQIAEEGGGIRHTAEMTSKGSDEEICNVLEKRLREMLKAGTTTVEIKSGYGLSPQDEIRYLKLLSRFKNRKDLPQIITTFLGLHWIPPGWTSDSYTKEMISLLPIVSKEKLADFVDAFPEQGFYSLTNAIEFSKYAINAGLGLKIHSDELTSIHASETFVKMNAVSIDHCQYISEEAIDLLKHTNTIVTLLPATSFFLNIKYANARKLIDHGARVALATDYNPGTSPSNKIQFTSFLAASQLQMNPYETLCAVTYNAALAVRKHGSVGSLEKGKIANILCWNIEEGISSMDGMIENITFSQPNPGLIFNSGVSVAS